MEIPAGVAPASDGFADRAPSCRTGSFRSRRRESNPLVNAGNVEPDLRDACIGANGRNRTDLTRLGRPVAHLEHARENGRAGGDTTPRVPGHEPGVRDSEPYRAVGRQGIEPYPAS